MILSDWLQKYERSYAVYQSVVSGLSEKEAHDALNKAIAKDKMHEEAVSVGLLMSILTDPSHAPKVTMNDRIKFDHRWELSGFSQQIVIDSHCS